MREVRFRIFSRLGVRFEMVELTVPIVPSPPFLMGHQPMRSTEVAENGGAETRPLFLKESNGCNELLLAPLTFPTKRGSKSLANPFGFRRTDLSCFAFHFLQKGWNILWLWGFFLGPGHCGQTNPKQGAQAQFNLHEGKVEGQRNCGRISPSEVSHNACTPNLPWW